MALIRWVEVAKFRLQTSISDANKTSRHLVTLWRHKCNTFCEATSKFYYVRAIHCVSRAFLAGKKFLLKQNLNLGILRQYILLMSSNESCGDPQSCESSSKTDPVSDASVNSDGSSNSLVHVTSHCFAYDDEPIAEPGETICVPEDPDGLLPATLEQRSDGRITLEQW